MRFAALSRCVAMLATAALCSPGALANCGSAVCLVNANWDTQGVWTQPGLRVDLRVEAIRQDTLRSGTRKVGASAIDEGEAVPLKTREKGWIATFDYAFDPRWGVAVSVPYIRRKHEQWVTPEAPDEPFVQPLRVAELGDIRVVGRYQFFNDASVEHGAMAAGVNAGVKLPTGKDDAAYEDGTRAEPGLQAGTGTTDAIVGAYWRQTFGPQLSWFGQIHFQRALNSNDDFKPGNKTRIDLGIRYAVSDAVSLLLQANALYAARDKGARAEPVNTGARKVALSPGVSAFVAKTTQVYAFYQRPVYQHVNGVQLSTRDAFSVGVSHLF